MFVELTSVRPSADELLERRLQRGLLLVIERDEAGFLDDLVDVVDVVLDERLHLGFLVEGLLRRVDEELASERE